jgi:hypothetical protein
MPSKKPAKIANKAAAKSAAAKPTLLAGGNPRIGKGTGDAPVQAYIAAMLGWKGEVARRLIIPADGGRGFQDNVDIDSSGTWTGFLARKVSTGSKSASRSCVSDWPVRCQLV